MPKRVDKQQQAIYQSCMSQYNDKKKCEKISWATALEQERKRNKKKDKEK